MWPFAFLILFIKWLWCKRRKRGIFADKGATPGGLIGMLSVDDLFKGRHFDRGIIILCMRWYLRFKLSFRDLVEMMAERELSLAHTTIMRRIQRYVPEFEKRWNRFARQAGGSWRVDETVAVQIVRMAARRVLAFHEGQAASTALQILGAVLPAALNLLSAN
jgi:hypothetical protein